jgi:gag-polypeptide of LTR copia-type
MAETCPNELWMKLKDMYLSKSLASCITLKKRLYHLRMEEGMNLRVHFGTRCVQCRWKDRGIRSSLFIHDIPSKVV